MDLLDSEKCKRFIQDTLYKGGKDDSFLYKCIDKLTPKRIIHIITSYFLGILIYKNLESVRLNIDKLLFEYHFNKDCDLNIASRKFSYIWMLICLFHDLGYVIENNKDKNDKWKPLITSFPKKPKGFPKIFSKKLIENYDKFRQCKFDVYDHGIYGGQIFYSELCRIREERELRPGEHLYWGQEMICVYSLVAWIIMCHSIWTISEKDSNVKSYRFHNLKKLIIQPNKLITVKNHPLLFLFCLVDTMDFSKISSCSDWMIQLKMEFAYNCIQLDLSECPDTKEQPILEMDNWLVNVKKTQNNIITISF